MEEEMRTIDRPSVIAHCQIVGEIINRLANNSNYCKTLCVAVVTVFAAFNNNAHNWWTLLVWGIPVLALCGLDCLFVSMKKRLTKENESFIHNVEKGEEVRPFVLEQTSPRSKFIDALKALGDVSIWLFYGAMLLALTLHLLLN